mmetsp:Transcript_15987/g.22032  ORF Transcript_15987/g.22032 Transcript_15987/m.22032 type:complete len:94 (+) Transcript_15987:64-345(+)
MSTLMSKDLNIVRPSTRLHAPPGGKSSISFGDDVRNDVKPLKTNTILLNSAPSAAAYAAAPEKSFQKEVTNAAPTTFRRVRQAPGGSSSLVIG